MSTVHNDVEKSGRAHLEYPSNTSGPTYAANGTGGLRQIANPGPLGLSAFALTTFVLSLINLSTRDVTAVRLFLTLRAQTTFIDDIPVPVFSSLSHVFFLLRN
jgi:hypothetical protein